MLLELFIKNIALAQEVRVTFDKNLNILTGETGSGKSMIIDALGLCLGKRGDRSMIRKGEDKAIVEGIFSIESPQVIKLLEENGIEAEDNLIITRELYLDGKNINRINGRNVNLTTLKEITSSFIDIHGQNEQSTLYQRENHIKMIDDYGKEELAPVKKEYQDIYFELKKLKDEFKEMIGSNDEISLQREMDLLKYQIEEIEEAKLSTGEEESLQRDIDLQRNSERISKILYNSYDVIYAGKMNVITAMGKTLKELEDISSYDQELKEAMENFYEAYYKTEEMAFFLRDHREKIEFNPTLLEELEERMDHILELKRKYGKTIEDVLEYRDQCIERLNYIDNLDEKIQLTRDMIDKKSNLLDKKSKELSIMRRNVANTLEKKLQKELEELNLKGSRFIVEFREKESSSLEGIDDLEFLVTFNPGEDLKPLVKVASGGEVSRFMLAFKTVVKDSDTIETMIFDEVDNGISGIAAEIVGKKLLNLAREKQIICITHLPQIAALSEAHYKIEKIVRDGRTKSFIKKLSEDEKIYELARIIGGSQLTEKTIENAKEIIENVNS